MVTLVEKLQSDLRIATIGRRVCFFLAIASYGIFLYDKTTTNDLPYKPALIVCAILSSAATLYFCDLYESSDKQLKRMRLR